MEPAIARQIVISLAGDVIVNFCLEACGSHEIELEMECMWVDSHQVSRYSHLNKSDIISNIGNQPRIPITLVCSAILISVAVAKKRSILIKKQEHERVQHGCYFCHTIKLVLHEVDNHQKKTEDNFLKPRVSNSGLRGVANIFMVLFLLLQTST